MRPWRCRLISSIIAVLACAAALAFIILARNVDLFTVRANVSLGFFLQNPRFDDYLVNAEFVFYYNEICGKAAGQEHQVCWTYDDWHDTIQAMLGRRFILHPTAAMLIGVFNAAAIGLGALGALAAASALVVEIKKVATRSAGASRKLGFALVSWLDLAVVIAMTCSVFCGVISFLFFAFITPCSCLGDRWRGGGGGGAKERRRKIKRGERSRERERETEKEKE